MSFFQNTQKNIHHNKCYITVQPFLSFKGHRWKKLGASIALAGYLNQILCPFLFISGLLLTTPSEAMDDDQHFKTAMAVPLKVSQEEEDLEGLKYEDHDIQTAIDLTLDNSTKIERAPGSKYLLKPKGQNCLTFSKPGEDPYFAALLPSCSCERREGTTRVSYFLDTFNQPDVYLEVLSGICEKTSLQAMQLFILAQEKERDGADFSKYKAIIAQANQEEKKFSEIKEVFKNELENRKGKFKQKNPDVFDELLGQISSLQQASFKIVFPFCTIGHWVTGELIGKKTGSTYTFTLCGHDPLGGGNFGGSYKKDQDQIQQCLQKRLRSDITLTSNVSPYRKRQGDLISCGPIMVDNTFKIILGEDLNIKKPYEFGALTLRENHLNLAKAYIKDHPSKETLETEEAKFLVRNTPRLEKIKTLLADKEAKPSTSTMPSPSTTPSPTYKLQLMCKPEDIINIKPGELGLFSKGNKLFCKFYNKPEIEINKSDNPTKGLPSEWIDRMLTSINRLKIALDQEEDGQQGLASFNHNLAFETIKETDIKDLLNYTLMQGYTPPKLSKEVPPYSASPSSNTSHSPIGPIPEKKLQAFSHEHLASRSVLAFGHPQQQESKQNEQYKKISSLRPEAASSLLKIDEVHQQQFGDVLNSTLGVNAKSQEDIHHSFQDQEQKGAPQPLATFHNEYCERGVISQSIALDILQLNQYGYGIETAEPKSSFPYCFTDIQSIEPFSYGERFCHYSFHSTLFSKGILPVGLCTLKNVCILKERNLSAYDAQLEAKTLSPQFVRRFGQDVRILEPTYHSYTVQVQSEPRPQRTLNDLYRIADGLKQISPESVSSLIMSHLLTGSKESLKDYLLLPTDESDKMQLVLAASQSGVYPVIAEIAGGEHAFQHITHLTSDLFLIPELMNQPLAKPIADQLSQIIPEVVVLNWLAKLQQSNDFYQHWHRQGNIGFEALLDAGFPLGVVKDLPSRLCTSLYKMQQLLKSSADRDYLTHDKIFKELFPAVHTVYAQGQKANAESGVEQSPHKIASRPLEEILNQYVKLDGRLPDGHYVFDLLQAEKTKDAMPLQKVQDAAQDLIDRINLNDFEDVEQKKTLLTKIAKEFLEQGINGRHESWSTSSFWQSLLFKTDDPDLLKLVLGRGAKINAHDKAGNYVLHNLLKTAIPLEQLKDCLTVLSDHNVELDQKDGKGLTALDIIIAPEYSDLEKAASLFAHLVNLRAGRIAAALPQEDKLVDFYHKIRGAKVWTNDVQEAFALLQYNHPKLSWKLAVSEILPKEKELKIPEVLEGITQSLTKLKAEKEQLEAKEDLTTEEDDELTNLEERIGQLSPILNTLKRHSQARPEQFWKLFNEKPYLKDYCQTSGTKIRGLTLGERTLPEEVKSQLWEKPDEQDKKFKRFNTHGRRDVGKAKLNGHVLYFKRYPELPGFEYAMDVLHHQVIGYGTPWSDLVRMENEPFLVSLGIQGLNLHDLLKQDPDKDPEILNQLETKSLQKLIIMSMLTNPEDQKPDQFIVEEMLGHQDGQGKTLYRLICVDNDHALTPSIAKVVKDGLEKRVVQVKSFLYCLPQMMAILDEEVKNFFLTLNPVEKLQEWLKEIAIMDQLYQGKTTRLFEDEEVKAFLHYADNAQDKEDSKDKKDKDCFVGGIPFRDQMIHGIHDRWVKLRDLLDPKSAKNQERKGKKITLISLLKELTPVIGGRYEKGFNHPQQNLSAWKRFLTLDGPSYGVTNEGRLETTITSSLFLTSQNIPSGEDLLRFLKRNTELSPQKRLEELNNAVNLQQIKMEKNKDLKYFNDLKTGTQRSTFLKTFRFENKPIGEQEAFLKKLEAIYRDEPESAPQHLYLQNCKMLTNMWLLQKIKFENISLLHICSCNQIKDKFPDIAEKCENLTQLIIRNIPELTSFESSEFLELKYLNISFCLGLENLDIKAPKLRKLNASWCGSLRNLKLNTPQLREINLRGDKGISEGDFSAILTQSPKLKKIQLQGCDKIPYAKITELDPSYPVKRLETCSPETKPRIIKAVEEILKGKRTLEKYSSSNGHIGDVGVLCLLPALNANTTLTSLDLEHNKITDVSPLARNTTLTNLVLYNNQITDVSPFAHNTTLTSLYLDYNQITDVYPFAHNTTLTSLDLVHNKITDVSFLAHNTTLTELNLRGNNITDVSFLAHNTTLTSLDLEHNKITDVSPLARNTTLTNLVLHNNQITDVSPLARNTTLTSLDLESNQITDVSFLARNTTLTWLRLVKNQITNVLPFAQNTSLTSLDLAYNKIEDVSPVAQIISLKELGLKGQKITDRVLTLLLSKTSLRWLDLSNSQMTDVSSFAQSTSLTRLDLEHNQIRDASPFANNTTLTTLDLSHNQITDLSPFAHNTTLTSLNLYNNQITDASPFANNTTLTSLDLTCNQITDVSPFAQNTSLTSLDLYYNKITNAEKQLIKDMLNRNNSLAYQRALSQPVSPQNIKLTHLEKSPQSVSSKDEQVMLDKTSTHSHPLLTGTLHGKPLQFVEKELPIDNDCGFHGLNLDRNTAIQQLLKSQSNAEIRALVAPEIKAAFIEGTIPSLMRGTWYNRLHQAYHQEVPTPEVERELDVYSNDPRNYRFFIREYLGGGGWLSYQLNSTSTMDALAKLNNLTVHIWQPSPQKHALKCIYSTQPYGEKYGEKSTIHLFHTQKDTHYNLLEAITVPSILGDLPFDSQISLFPMKEMLPQIKNLEGFFQDLSKKMEAYYADKKDADIAAEQEQWQKSFDQMRSTLLSENHALKGSNQSLRDTSQDFQVKTSDNDTKNHFFTGLSLDGGGIRGLVPAVMLRDFQQEARKYKNNIHIHEMFDYIGGTSVGGILALGLTAPHEKILTQPLKTLDEMVDLFKNEGATIFQRTFWGSYMLGHDLLKPKFTPQGLENFLETNFRDLPLSASLTPIVVTAVNHTQAPLEGFLFDTTMARLHPDHNFLMRDVGRATSAAQTYFPEACIWNLEKTASYKFSDGGPWLNNPSGVVYNKILKNFPHASHKNITMLSLGTGEAKPDYSAPSTTGIKGQGAIGWMKPLIYGQMNLNVFGVDLAMQETLGNNYIRLQPRIVDQSGTLKEADLADYTPKLLEEYMTLASKEFDTYIKAHEDFIRNLIEKRAQRTDPF